MDLNNNQIMKNHPPSPGLTELTSVILEFMFIYIWLLLKGEYL